MLDNIYSPLNPCNEEFTEKEQKVLHLIAKGYGYRSISEFLSVPYRAVLRRVLGIRQKTGLMEREDIMVYAREHGYGESQVRAC
jgi:DNA-binding NarL/FixJ family response regulator